MYLIGEISFEVKYVDFEKKIFGEDAVFLICVMDPFVGLGVHIAIIALCRGSLFVFLLCFNRPSDTTYLHTFSLDK